MSMAEQVQMYLDHLEVERGSATNTLQSYARDLRRYVEFLAARGIDTLSEVDESDIREFLVSLRRGDPDKERLPLADSSIARTLVATRGFQIRGRRGHRRGGRCAWCRSAEGAPPAAEEPASRRGAGHSDRQRRR